MEFSSAKLNGSGRPARPARPVLSRVSAWVMGIVAALCLGLYLLALSALADLDAAAAAGAAERDPLSAPKALALFLAAQILPLRQPGDEQIQPGRVFQDCPDCPAAVEIPAGYYLMGSTLFERGRYRHFFGRHPVRDQFQFLNREGPRRLVHIARPFALSQYEITFAQWDAAQDDPDWQAVTGRAPRKPILGMSNQSGRAVTNVDRNDAEAYAKWLSHKTGQHYRIPTEAEWEYAARAGTMTRYPWGNEVGVNHASCVGCSDLWGETRPGPVGLYPPNGFGLHDMNGNAWEWVQDCFAPYHPASTADGSAYTYPGCELGVFKGGTALATAWQNRSAMRVGPHPFNNGEGSTIRLLREID
jgi:formylglycine-generating enzyme required for sulfatase activity